jgi:pimeloyl-ACP methyl ester carboxylesterase
MLGRSGMKHPVLLVHGISLSSTCWVVNGPDESLGFILADAGYDVWMHNTRGNTFSRGHKSLKDTDSAFWDFSMDAMALMDLPAVIDYILSTTGAPKLSIVSHSQGSTLTFMLLSSLPAYNDKISLHIAMGPVAYVSLMTSQMMATFCAAGNLQALHNLPPSEYFMMAPPLQSLILNGACQSSIVLPVCLGIVTQLFGASTHISGQDYQRLFSYWPSSTSFGDVLHWAKMWQKPRPILTHSDSDQEYDLSKIRAKTILLSGSTDVLAPTANMELIKANMKSSGALGQGLNLPSFGHMDFIWAADAKDLAYPSILKALLPSSA